MHMQIFELSHEGPAFIRTYDIRHQTPPRSQLLTEVAPEEDMGGETSVILRLERIHSSTVKGLAEDTPASSAKTKLTMPLQFTVRHLTSPSGQELDKLSSILLEALSDDSISRAGGANDPGLMKEFHRTVMAGTAAGAHLFGAFEDTTGEPIGTIAFYGPGKEIMGDEVQRAQGFDEFLATLPKEAIAWWEQFLPEYTAITDAAIGPGAKKDAWTFNSFAVAPAYRGNGVGRALLEAGEKLAENDGIPIIFEAEQRHNVTMYQHLGYVIIGETHLKGGMGVDDFKLTIMKKDYSHSED